MPSKSEQVIQAVESLLNGITAVTKIVKRGGERPKDIKNRDAYYILLDGEPGDPDGPLLGDLPPWYYQHRIEVEIYVQKGDEDTRQSTFDTALQAIETGFDADPTLGGLIKGFQFRRPEAIETGPEGDAGIKSASLPIFVEYESNTRL